MSTRGLGGDLGTPTTMKVVTALSRRHQTGALAVLRRALVMRQVPGGEVLLPSLRLGFNVEPTT